jgi:SAM-dependent methyltransferase
MTPSRLRRLAFDFRAARAVYAGVEIGVFEALGSRELSADELAPRTGTDARALRVLLGALVAVGVLEARGPGYRLLPQLHEALLPNGEGYLGNLFLHDLWHWTSWAALGDVVRSGRAHQDRTADRHLGDADVLREFLPNYNRAMEQSAGDSPRLLAERIAALEPDSVLDLGGGSGDLLCEVLARLPFASGVLAERGFALERARDRCEASGKRLDLLEIDFEREEIPGDFDVVVLSRVLMGLPPESAAAVVARAAGALAPAGHLVVHDFDPRSRVGSLLSLDMLLNTGGEVHAPETIADWLEAAGLVPVEKSSLLPYTHYLCASRAA